MKARTKPLKTTKNPLAKPMFAQLVGMQQYCQFRKYIMMTKVAQCCHKLVTFQITGLPNSEWQEAITTVIIGTSMPIIGACFCRSKNSSTMESGNIFIKCVTLRRLQSNMLKHVASIKPVLFKAGVSDT